MIKLTKDEELIVADKLQTYLMDQLDTDVSQIGVLQLIDFLNENVGKYYYNKAIHDAENFMNDKVTDLMMLEK